MKISVGIVCRNNRHQLAFTLNKNLTNNSNPDIEFVLLDYYSTDGLSSWLFEKFEHHLDSGKIKYIRIIDQKQYNPFSSRNILYSVCDGEIICSIEPNYYIGEKFIPSIKNLFSLKRDIFINAVVRQHDHVIKTDCICFQKKDFISLKGLNEDTFSDCQTYFEDCLIKAKKTIHTIEVDTDFKQIHLNDVSKNENLIRELVKVFVVKNSDLESEFLFFFKNQTFHFGTFNSTNDINFGMILKKESFKVGKWSAFDNNSNNEGESIINLNLSEKEIKIFKKQFIEITNFGFFEFIYKHYFKLVKDVYSASDFENTSTNQYFLKGELIGYKDGTFHKIVTENGEIIKHTLLEDLIFRIDDIGVIKNTAAQIHIINNFINNNICLVLGIQTNELIQNQEMINYLTSICSSDLIEFSCHSSNHPNLGNMSYSDQKIELELFFQQFKSVLPKTIVKSLIPPYNSYDENTTLVCQELGIKCISSSVGITQRENFQSRGIRYFDASVSTGGWLAELQLQNASDTIKNIRNELEKKSADNFPIVIMLHAHEYCSSVTGKMTPKGEIELNKLTEEVKKADLTSTLFKDCL